MPLPDSSAGVVPALRNSADDPIGGILALDLASTVGWAYGLAHEKAPRHGVWHLARLGGEGMRYCSFENTLAEHMAQWEPSHLILEAALPLPAMNNVAAARQAFGLRAIAYSEAYRASCRVSELDAPTARRDVMGVRQFSKDRVKREVVAWCRRAGWKVVDHNAGDACILWAWMRARKLGIAPPGSLLEAA